MMKILMALLVVLCCLVIIASFFMPWAKAVTTATKVATGIKDVAQKEFGGSALVGKFVANLDKATRALNQFGDVRFKTVISGYEIPVMVNRKDSKTAISLIQVFSNNVEGLGKKVLILYLIPTLAAVCIVLALLGLKNNIFIVIISIISGIISIGGLYKVMTANIANNIVQITLERGLWQTLYGYLLVFVFSILWLAGNIWERRR